MAQSKKLLLQLAAITMCNHPRHSVQWKVFQLIAIAGAYCTFCCIESNCQELKPEPAAEAVVWTAPHLSSTSSTAAAPMHCIA